MKTTEEEKEEMACKGRPVSPGIKGRRPTGRGEEEEPHSRGRSRPRHHPRQEGSHSPLAGVTRVILSLLFVLVFAHQTKGELFNTTRLENVSDMNEKSIIVCVRPHGPAVVLSARMYVMSTANDNIYDAGNVTVEGMEENVWHNITLDYGTREYVHILDATLDGESVPFNKPNKNMWTSSYKYNTVAFLVKGAVEITGCPPPEDPTTTTATTTAATTTADITINTAESWIWILGSVGSVPALPLIIGVAVLVFIVIAIAIVVCCSRKRGKKTPEDRRLSTRSIPLKKTYSYDEGPPRSVYDPVPQDELNGAYQRSNLKTFGY
ncbi:uncharacterized protein [Palaemon carinicauda]|uniref:uncharacterized protein isoform X2 n=1 Tax=Palaemon carinicauda TaxID=392227 RepID=UPI0035B5DEFF